MEYIQYIPYVLGFVLWLLIRRWMFGGGSLFVLAMCLSLCPGAYADEEEEILESTVNGVTYDRCLFYIHPSGTIADPSRATGDQFRFNRTLNPANSTILGVSDFLWFSDGYAIARFEYYAGTSWASSPTAPPVASKKVVVRVWFDTTFQTTDVDPFNCDVSVNGGTPVRLYRCSNGGNKFMSTNSDRKVNTAVWSGLTDQTTNWDLGVEIQLQSGRFLPPTTQATTQSTTQASTTQPLPSSRPFAPTDANPENHIVRDMGKLLIRDGDNQGLIEAAYAAGAEARENDLPIIGPTWEVNDGGTEWGDSFGEATLGTGSTSQAIADVDTVVGGVFPGMPDASPPWPVDLIFESWHHMYGAMLTALAAAVQRFHLVLGFVRTLCNVSLVLFTVRTVMVLIAWGLGMRNPAVAGAPG